MFGLYKRSQPCMLWTWGDKKVRYMKSTEEIVFDLFPNIPLPDRIKLQSEVQVYINLLERHDPIRKMTILEVLSKMYIPEFDDSV